MRRLRVSWLLGAALAGAAMASVQPAHADADDLAERAPRASESSKDEKPEPPLFHLGVDMVVGAASTNTLNESAPPGSTGELTGAASLSRVRVTSYSFLLDGGIKVTDGFEVLARLPFAGGSFIDRADAGIGSLEIAGVGKLKLADGLHLELGLGISLPTAQGAQLPTAAQIANGTAISAGAYDSSNYDRFTVQRAASMARGYEDDELFEPQHFGINPRLRLIVGSEGKWHLDPWVKLDNLIAVNSTYSFIDELVFGVNVGGFLLPEIEPVLRVWGNVPLAGSPFDSAVAVVEPQIRFHLGPVTPYVGGILPIAGPLTSPYDFGVRVGISGRF
jgi:hypothetical protein